MQDTNSQTLTFDENTHTYYVGGMRVDNVTNICRFLHYDDAAGADIAMRNAAADRGTRIHAACQAYDYDGFAEVDSDISGYLKGYLSFLRDYQIDDWIAVERQMHGYIHGEHVAGTVDRIGVINGRKFVVDIKTGSKVNHAAASVQCAAYLHLYLGESFNKEVIGADSCNGRKWGLAVLHLKKDGGYTFKEFDTLYSHFMLEDCVELNTYIKEKKYELTSND